MTQNDIAQMLLRHQAESAKQYQELAKLTEQLMQQANGSTLKMPVIDVQTRLKVGGDAAPQPVQTVPFGKSMYIQNRRFKGFRVQNFSPDGRRVVSCNQPGPWANPFAGHEPKTAVKMYHEFIVKENISLDAIKGKHLACLCKKGVPCHVQDVLIPLINGDEPKLY